MLLKQTSLDTGIHDLLIPIKTTKGRKYPRSNDDDWPYYSMNPWKMDETKILDSKALRREAAKTQVHSLPPSHVRTRRVHTDEVVSFVAKIASILGLNVELCQAAALGHDVGHPPFGHAIEKVLRLNHPINGTVILQEVERKGAGLNLTREVVSAIMNHSRNNDKLWIDARRNNEENLLVVGDKISYIFSDFNDFTRLGLLAGKDVPEEFNELGCGPNAQRKRIAACADALSGKAWEKAGFLSPKTPRLKNSARSGIGCTANSTTSWTGA